MQKGAKKSAIWHGLGANPMELQTKYMDILLEIHNHRKTLTEISKSLNIPLSTTRKRLNWLKENGYLSKTVAFNKRIYELTNKGKDAVALFFGISKPTPTSSNKILRCHKVEWRLQIIKKPKWLEEELKKHNFEVKPTKSWVQYIKKEEEMEATIIFTTKSVRVYLWEFYVNYPSEYYAISLDKIKKIRKNLMERFKGLVLGEPNKASTIESQHIARQYDELAIKFQQEAVYEGGRWVYRGENIDIDASKNVPELEFKHKTDAVQHAEDYAKFVDDWLKNPFYAKDFHELRDLIVRGFYMIKENFDITNKNLETFSVGMSEHMTLIKYLQNVTFSLQESIEKMMEVNKSNKEIMNKFVEEIIKLQVEISQKKKRKGLLRKLWNFLFGRNN